MPFDDFLMTTSEHEKERERKKEPQFLRLRGIMCLDKKNPVLLESLELIRISTSDESEPSWLKP